MKLKSLSTKNVDKVIKSLKPKNSAGYDRISTGLLKVSSAFIISPLTYICNKSISLGVFLDRLKYAVVKSLFKKVTKITSLTTDLYLYLAPFQKYLKKLFIINSKDI